MTRIRAGLLTAGISVLAIAFKNSGEPLVSLPAIALGSALIAWYDSKIPDQDKKTESEGGA